jgi:hypothetical protein
MGTCLHFHHSHTHLMARRGHLGSLLLYLLSIHALVLLHAVILLLLLASLQCLRLLPLCLLSSSGGGGGGGGGQEPNDPALGDRGQRRSPVSS